MKKTTTRMECLECGKLFSKHLGPCTYEVRCPKCGSYDTDLADVGVTYTGHTDRNCED